MIPIAGTVNATRIQSLIKAVELDLEKKIGLPSGQKAWVKMYLKLSTNCISKKNNEINKMISTQMINHEQNSTNNRATSG
jgi:hypothetical protein